METIEKTVEILLFLTITMTALLFFVVQIIILTWMSRYNKWIYEEAYEGTIAYAILALLCVLIVACITFL